MWCFDWRTEKKCQKRIKHCLDCRHNSAWKVNIIYKDEFSDCYSILAQFVQFSFVQKHSPEVFYKKAVLRNFAIFAGKSPVLNSPTKKRLQHWCFSVNIAKFLWTPALKNICEQLFLVVSWLLPAIFESDFYSLGSN